MANNRNNLSSSRRVAELCKQCEHVEAWPLLYQCNELALYYVNGRYLCLRHMCEERQK